MKNVLCVPAITKNLLSISSFTKDDNVNAEFCSNGCVIKDWNTKRVLLRGTLKQGLYELKLVAATPQSIKFMKSVSLATADVNKINCSGLVNQARTSALSTNGESTKYNVLVAARTNSVLWHAKLGHPSPLILKRTLRFPFNAKLL